MAAVRYIYGTDAQILALESSELVERAFYYPSDKNYFYQAISGELRKYGDGDAEIFGGVGAYLNNKVIGVPKKYIREGETALIDQDYQYTIHGELICEGEIINNGELNIQI